MESQSTHLGLSPRALLHKTPRHGASDSKGLEKRSCRIANAQGNEFLSMEKGSVKANHTKSYEKGIKDSTRRNGSYNTRAHQIAVQVHKSTNGRGGGAEGQGGTFGKLH